MSSRTKDRNGFHRKFNVAPHMGYMSVLIRSRSLFFAQKQREPPSWEAGDMCSHQKVCIDLCLIWGWVVAGRGDLKPPQVCGRWLGVSYDRQPPHLPPPLSTSLFPPFPTTSLWSGKYGHTLESSADCASGCKFVTLSHLSQIFTGFSCQEGTGSLPQSCSGDCSLVRPERNRKV